MNYNTYINRDFKRASGLRSADRRHTARRRRTRVWQLRWALGLVVITGLLVSSISLQRGTAWSEALPKATAGFSEERTAARRITIELELPPKDDAPPKHATQQAEAESSERTTHVVTVSRGDSLYVLFQRLGLPPGALPRVLAAGGHAHRLKRLYPGQILEFHLSPENELQRLVHRIDESTSLHVIQAGEAYESKLVHEQFEARTTTATGTIASSLFLSAQEAGLSDPLIMGLVDIFGWDIDFALDIREGDRFTVVHEELFKNGEKVRDGDILAAEFINQGNVIRAVRYVDDKSRSDYYSPDGRSMRKAFLRTPVKFSRISSRFTHRRWHPILHKFRAHRGVDYAAPRGTPVKATGDGKVTFAGRKGGLGKAVFVQHGGKYTTVYGHLSRYARAARRGKQVRQGQVIGYVGSTGLASGPHLHYEFRVNGVHRNPLKVRLPKAAPIDPKYLQDFNAKTRGLVAQLDVLSRLQIALNQ